ncbi:DUF1828 domain-containing protein [Lentilactobacillus hilgardii]|uniref:DUF1828 domain-containing protein n=1 Tax=Lentilactobacillus hilgardii TaxID=1588 RepID=A0A6P1EB53_LENHI|nr:DUF1828 domain-containing protein [Lentilactobacillus hilgardii]EEI71776.1 hypothetical protein HMPREF0496_0966 [Lentilactobacillus hilgardii ATCC 27305]MCT3393085.1 DUF1828 domain-containing protein [Lentilactobacillus hilgardii]QHB51354.1 DUF1828 domain-containing protein [Lentilactobacillus hilgardii]RRG10345.1 MAG: DUF1828 domain-containing protein [Lactobacillus sp.]
MENATRIEVPFLGLGLDDLIIYAVPLPDNQIRLTDDGGTLNTETITPTKRTILVQQIQRYGLRLENDEIMVEAGSDRFPEKSQQMIEGLILINIFVLQQ